MFTARRLSLSLYAVALLTTSTFAQGAKVKPPAPAPVVTASLTPKGLRFVALGAVKRMRVEVLGADGASVLTSEFRPGSVFDWSPSAADAQALADGSYQLVLTMMDVAGRLSIKQCAVTLRGGEVALDLGEADKAGGAETEDTAAAVKPEEPPAMTFNAHDGRVGQVVSTTGALSFRLGDFFSGKDKEAMRLTGERLTLAGALEAKGGIRFSDGTALTSTGRAARVNPDGTLSPAASGAGTQNRLAKWAETGGAGTLTDAAGVETSGLFTFGQNSSGQVAPLFPSAPSLHVVEVGATGTRSPLTLAGGSGVMEFWKDLGGGTGSPAAAVAFGLAQPGTAATNDMVFSTFTPAALWNERMRITTGGNVGIGTPSPQSPLDVAGAINTSTQFNIGGNRVLSISGGGNAPNTNTFAGVGAGAGNTNGTGSFNSFFGYSAGSAVRTSSGNTIIGASAGITIFTSHAGDNNTLLGVSTDLSGNGLTNATAIGANALVSQSNSLVLGSISGNNIGTTDTNVGIGTTAPASRLHVNGTSWFQGDTTPLPSTAGRGVAIGTGTNSNNSYGYIFAFNYANSSVSDLLLNYPGGRVGIGTFNPDQTLTVNGNASKVGGGSWATFSDERLKQIKGSFTPGLRAVLQLRPVRYEYRRDNALGIKSAGEHVGFSAQAVQQIIPEAVTQDDKGYLLVNNDPILWTMLNAIKEQQQEIEELHQQNTRLSARLGALERRPRRTARRH